MKLFIYIAVGVYFVQTCLAAPSAITDRMIEQLRNNIELADDVYIEPELFESIMEALKKYPKTSKITSLALQGDTCTENSIDVMHIIAIATGKTDEETLAKYKRGETLSLLNLTNDQLKLIEADLKSDHPSEKVQNAMKILRGFGSSSVSKSTGIKLLESAAEAMEKGCPSTFSIFAL